MTNRAPRRWLSALLMLGLALCVPSSTLARPSLIDLDGDLQQVIDGLCHGDPALCGLPAPLSVAGQIDFDGGTYVADFAALRFSFGRPAGGGFSFADLEVTVDASGLGAQLSAALASGFIFSTVELVVPNPSGPGNVTLLELEDAVLRTIDVAADGAWTPLTLEFPSAQLTLLGSSSNWNIGLGSGGGCTVAPGEKHVALAGNDASLLNPGEVEADFALAIANPGGGTTVAFRYDRAPSSTSACYLRHTAQATNLAAVFSRLSPLSDTFATQLVEEGIDVATSTVNTYTLTVSGGSYAEEILLQSISADLTTKTFNPGTGAETSSTTQSLP